MLRRADEMVTEVVESFRGGKGSVEVTRIYKPEEFAGKGRLYARIKLKPGSSIGLHQHVGDFEGYYILSGEGTVNDNGVERPIKAGDLLYTPNMESHSIENTGSTDLEFIGLVLFA